MSHITRWSLHTHSSDDLNSRLQESHFRNPVFVFPPTILSAHDLSVVIIIPRLIHIRWHRISLIYSTIIVPEPDCPLYQWIIIIILDCYRQSVYHQNFCLMVSLLQICVLPGLKSTILSFHEFSTVKGCNSHLSLFRANEFATACPLLQAAQARRAGKAAPTIGLLGRQVNFDRFENL